MPGCFQRRSTSVLLTALFLAALTGCKAMPAPNAGFILERPEAKKPPDLPFHSAWFKPDLDLNAYDKIMIAPVDTKHLMVSNVILEKGTGNRPSQITELAGYAQHAFRSAFRNDPTRHFQVVDKRGPRTLNLEIAITEMVATRPGFNAVSYFFIFRPVQTASVAMEGRIRDAKSGNVLVTFSDKENAKISPIHVNDFNRLGHAEAAFDEWASQLVSVLNRKQGEIIKDPSRFNLNPLE